MKVLVVEDEPRAASDLIREIGGVLSRDDIELVDSESEFHDRFERFSISPPTVLVLDVMLRWSRPRGGVSLPQPPEYAENGGFTRAGLRILKRIRADSRWSGTFILIHTAIPVQDLLERGTQDDPRIMFFGKHDQSAVQMIRSIVSGSSEETFTTRVFLVHGRDDGLRETVARFMEKLGIQVVILQEQPNRGSTAIIEKFERNSDVHFAVVLVTPDDVGGLSGDTSLQGRARQNVIFELGYFSAKLGRDRVCVMQRGNIEAFSDFGGVLHIGIDHAGAWKMELMQNMIAAGLPLDPGRLF